jgi:hypothetical protein
MGEEEMLQLSLLRELAPGLAAAEALHLQPDLVPDVLSPEFAAEARLQSLLVAQSPRKPTSRPSSIWCMRGQAMSTANEARRDLDHGRWIWLFQQASPSCDHSG